MKGALNDYSIDRGISAVQDTQWWFTQKFTTKFYVYTSFHHISLPTFIIFKLNRFLQCSVIFTPATSRWFRTWTRFNTPQNG